MQIINTEIKIVSLDGMDILDQYNERIKTIILSLRGSFPGTRNFGLSGDVLDENVNLAANILAVDLQEQLDIYVPEVSVDSIEPEYGLDGKLILKINIRGRDE